MLRKVQRGEIPEAVLSEEFGPKNPNLLHNVEPLPIVTEGGELVDYYVHNYGSVSNPSPDQEKWHRYYHFEGTVTLEAAIAAGQNFSVLGYYFKWVPGGVFRLYRRTRGVYRNTVSECSDRWPKADVRRVATTHHEYICDTRIGDLVGLLERFLQR